MKRVAIAQELWNHLEQLFHDRKITRTIYLEEQFSNTSLVYFTNMMEFYNKIKSLADQLANVDNPVLDKNMVLKLIRGLGKKLGVPSRMTMLAKLLLSLPLLPPITLLSLAINSTISHMVVVLQAAMVAMSEEVAGGRVN
ncbi:Retrovirus-related Pol polyprotein from transposon TNT 1-94 [Bienertia sinuspersici]